MNGKRLAILKTVAMAAVLLGFGAGVASAQDSTVLKNFFAPSLRIKGTVATSDGGNPEGCKLEVFNRKRGNLVKTFEINARFTIYFSDAVVSDGVRFAVSCENYPGAGEKVYSRRQLEAANFKIDTGAFTVAGGGIGVTGKVVDETGATPEGCSVGLYKAGQKVPLVSWDAPGTFAGTFDLAEAGGFFMFEASCPGYEKRGTSGVYTANAIDEGNPTIVTRDLVVKR